MAVFFSLSLEGIHRRAHPRHIPHLPGHPPHCDGVHAVRIHRSGPGNHNNRCYCVSQNQGKDAGPDAGWWFF